MKLFKCSTCDKILEEKFIDKHPASAITWLDATEHEERKKKVEEIEGANEDEIEEEKEKHLESIRKSLRKLTSQELDKELIRLSEELEEIKKKLNPDKEDEEKQSKSAMAEFIGIDNYHSAGVDVDTAVKSLIISQNQRNRQKKSRHSQSYSVLTLDQNHNESKRGDSLFQRMGSVD